MWPVALPDVVHDRSCCPVWNILLGSFGIGTSLNRMWMLKDLMVQGPDGLAIQRCDCYASDLFWLCSCLFFLAACYKLLWRDVCFFMLMQPDGSYLAASLFGGPRFCPHLLRKAKEPDFNWPISAECLSTCCGKQKKVLIAMQRNHAQNHNPVFMRDFRAIQRSGHKENDLREQCRRECLVGAREIMSMVDVRCWGPDPWCIKNCQFHWPSSVKLRRKTTVTKKALPWFFEVSIEGFLVFISCFRCFVFPYCGILKPHSYPQFILSIHKFQKRQILITFTLWFMASLTVYPMIIMVYVSCLFDASVSGLYLPRLAEFCLAALKTFQWPCAANVYASPAGLEAIDFGLPYHAILGDASACSLNGLQLQPNCSMRPLSLVASGSFSSLVIAAVRELTRGQSNYAPLAQDLCPVLFPEANQGIDLPSLLLGVLIGLLLGPLIDLLYFLRHSLPAVLHQVPSVHPAPQPRPLHRVLDGQQRH